MSRFSVSLLLSLVKVARICCYKIFGVKKERSVILLGKYSAKYNLNEKGGSFVFLDFSSGD
jgi:hypothetical protein